MNIKEIPIEELIKEVNRRKNAEIPILVKEINEKLERLKVLAGSINHETEPFRLEKLDFDDYRNVIYIDSEM